MSRWVEWEVGVDGKSLDSGVFVEGMAPVVKYNIYSKH